VAHPKASAGHFHAVQFYKDDDSLISLVAKFLAEGFMLNQPGVIIATPEHRVAIEEALESLHLDVTRM
jgi:hypothetical protein